MPKKEGALPDHKILEMMGAEFIKGADAKDITDCLNRAGFAPHSFEYPLERGVTYLARLNESLALPDGVYGYCNPKSSTGQAGLRRSFEPDQIFHRQYAV